MEKLDKTFSEPILVYSMISQAQDKKNNNENTGQDMSEYMKEIDMDSLDNQAKMDLAAVQNGTMTQEQFMAAHFDLIRDTVRDKMGSAIDSMGDSLVQSSAISFVKKEYKKIGVDVEIKQFSYLWSTGAKMLAMALLMTVSAIIVGFLASKVSASIGKELREKVFNKVLEFSDAEINKFSTASLITRSTNDVQQIQMGMCNAS